MGDGTFHEFDDKKPEAPKPPEATKSTDPGFSRATLTVPRLHTFTCIACDWSGDYPGSILNRCPACNASRTMKGGSETANEPQAKRRRGRRKV